eukprot:TRINITY_DN728_c0_g1_i3.p1 TRINITY_DN728_c0_g1~~TRINITY_DN728_c0_g1_i3.p1  ORF type:complete len:850 (-),score=287.33 TRINITY_DN728_c0_g1_i3:22-2304(-)
MEDASSPTKNKHPEAGSQRPEPRVAQTPCPEGGFAILPLLPLATSSSSSSSSANAKNCSSETVVPILAITKETFKAPKTADCHQNMHEVPHNPEIKELECPICCSTMQDPYVTSCGHSFCHSCINLHLSKNSCCPCCRHQLKKCGVFPNYALNNLLQNKGLLMRDQKKVNNKDRLKELLSSGSEWSVSDLTAILRVISEKKKELEREEQESEIEILLHFLESTKQEHCTLLEKILKDIEMLSRDIQLVEAYKKTLSSQSDDISPPTKIASHSDRQHPMVPDSSMKDITDPDSPRSNQSLEKIDDEAIPLVSPLRKRSFQEISETSPKIITSNPNLCRKKHRINEHLKDLQECYFSISRTRDASNPTSPSVPLSPSPISSSSSSSTNSVTAVTTMMDQETTPKHEAASEGLKKCSHLGEFSQKLLKFTKYTSFKSLASLSYGDTCNGSSIVSSIEFDKTNGLFATGGVTKKIKIFDLNTIIDDPTESNNHFPLQQMSCSSKVSCLSWNSYLRSHLISSDYGGLITLWDTQTAQKISTYDEHDKRVWSVDFSKLDPTLLASGSDDSLVKIWSTNEAKSVMNIETKANVCCVKFNPHTSNQIAFGSADHNLHFYDLRNTNEPLFILNGHRKAVSYIKFLSDNEILSASTDSTLRLWKTTKPALERCTRVYQGHTNEKNFVGLSIEGDHIACGSESNTVYTYFRDLSRPIIQHRFGPNLTEGRNGSECPQFVSSVCWKPQSNILLAANSQGSIKILQLADTCTD